jgi:serine/threonine protein phosphatase PrpC
MCLSTFLLMFVNGIFFSQVSMRAFQGARVAMEDEFLVADGGRLACVFDGHGGAEVSHYLRQHFHAKLHESLQQKHWEQEGDDEGHKKDTVPSLSTHVAALRSTYEQLEEEIIQDDVLQYKGSTAVAVLLHESPEGFRTLLSANVGDSRAILSRNQTAIELTRDHKPNSPREKQRILQLGEDIEWDAFARVYRVRNLSLSRAMGDRYAKPAVSAQVEIQHFPVDEAHDEFFLLASDGLWDVMSSKEVVSFVHQRMAQELGRSNITPDDRNNYEKVLRRNMAKFVALEALRRGSSDNVCVLIVWLQKAKQMDVK